MFLFKSQDTLEGAKIHEVIKGGFSWADACRRASLRTRTENPVWFFKEKKRVVDM